MTSSIGYSQELSLDNNCDSVRAEKIRAQHISILVKKQLDIRTQELAQASVDLMLSETRRKKQRINFIYVGGGGLLVGATAAFIFTAFVPTKK